MPVNSKIEFSGEKYLLDGRMDEEGIDLKTDHIAFFEIGSGQVDHDMGDAASSDQRKSFPGAAAAGADHSLLIAFFAELYREQVEDTLYQGFRVIRIAQHDAVAVTGPDQAETGVSGKYCAGLIADGASFGKGNDLADGGFQPYGIL